MAATSAAQTSAAPSRRWAAECSSQDGRGSMAALEGLARTWANETANMPLRVNLFNPGPVRTRMRAILMPGEDPLSLDTPEQVAEFIVPLCLPSFAETGKLYDYQSRNLLSFQSPA